MILALEMILIGGVKEIIRVLEITVQTQIKSIPEIIQSIESPHRLLLMAVIETLPHRLVEELLLLIRGISLPLLTKEEIEILPEGNTKKINL